MPVVRGERVDLPPVLVECEREVLAVLDPVVAVEAALEVGGVPLEPVGELGVLPDLAARAARRAPSRRTRTPGARTSPAGSPAASRRGTRSSPTSPSSTGSRAPSPRCGAGTRCSPCPWRSAYSSIQVSAARASISSSRTSARSPVQRSYSSSRTTYSGVASTDAVVRRVRALLERRHLPVAHLVEDPARVLVAEVVEPNALPVAERAQRRRGELGRERQRLQAREDAVAAEHRHEPREPRGRKRSARPRSAARSAGPRGRRGSAGTSPSARPSRTRRAAPRRSSARGCAACAPARGRIAAPSSGACPAPRRAVTTSSSVVHSPCAGMRTWNVEPFGVEPRGLGRGDRGRARERPAVVAEHELAAPRARRVACPSSSARP